MKRTLFCGISEDIWCRVSPRARVLRGSVDSLKHTKHGLTRIHPFRQMPLKTLWDTLSVWSSIFSNQFGWEVRLQHLIKSNAKGLVKNTSAWLQSLFPHCNHFICYSLAQNNIYMVNLHTGQGAWLKYFNKNWHKIIITFSDLMLAGDQMPTRLKFI